MAVVSATRDYSTGDSLTAANYDADRDEIISGVNSVVNAQVSATAAIASSKLTLTSITQNIVNTVSTGVGLIVVNSGTGVGLQVTSAASFYGEQITFTGAGTAFYITNATSTNPTVQIDNSGTGNGVFINQDGNGIALNIDSESTTATTVEITGINTSSSTVNISSTGILVSGYAAVGIHVSDSSSEGSGISVHNDGIGSGISIDQDGAGIALIIDTEQANDGTLFQITPAGTSPSAFYVIRNDDVTGNTCLVMNGQFMWFDTTGDLRRKGTNPTSDTDGDIIGVQT